VLLLLLSGVVVVASFLVIMELALLDTVVVMDIIVLF